LGSTTQGTLGLVCFCWAGNSLESMGALFEKTGPEILSSQGGGTYRDWGGRLCMGGAIENNVTGGGATGTRAKEEETITIERSGFRMVGREGSHLVRVKGVRKGLRSKD